ncbi:hypothetical protein MFRU_035g00440 [Monilinia fructicola]|nr:hypothetical protein MFRU_035g00440 [Monilinia fructicola]
MGAYVSKDLCQTHHNISFTCNITSDEFVAGTTQGKFEGNADIAGVGVLAAFFAISSIALITSACYLYTQTTQGQLTGAGGLLKRGSVVGRPVKTITLFSIMENIILSCSDQQIFTSGAYAITLRWAQCCRISAYHYNIVGNMMLMGCATHLLSMIIVSDYWKGRSIALLRTSLIIILYIFTGVILANQNTKSGPNTVLWPSGVPNRNETNSTMILPAACFLSGDFSFADTLNSTFASEKSLETAVFDSTPGNHVVGWNLYILMLLFYIISFLADIARAGCNRYKPVDTQHRSRWFGPRMILCASALLNSFNYIRNLRNWMDASGWIQPDIGGKNPENDPTTFGQMVPILMTLMTLFTLIQDLSEKRVQERENKKDSDVNPQSFELLPHMETESQPPTPYASHFELPREKKDSIMVNVISVPSTPVLSKNDQDNGRAVMYRTSSAPVNSTSMRADSITGTISL